MAATERIEEFFSKEALEQFNELNAKLGISITGFEKLATKAVEVNKALGGNISIKKFTEETKNLTESEKALTKQVDELAKANAKLNSLYTEEAKKLVEIKAQQAERNRQLKEEAQLNSLASDSIKAKGIQLKQLQAQYDKLGAAEREAASGKELLKSVQDLDKEVKALEGSTGRFRLNVGNYASAFGEAFGSISTQLKQIRSDINSGTFKGNALDELIRKEQTLAAITEQLSQEFSTSRQQSRAFQEAVAQIGLTFGEQSRVFQEFKNEVGEGVNALSDIRKSINLAASSTKGIDQLIGAAQGITGAFSVAQGAAALFGEENEDLQKTFVKLQAAMTILNGLQAIQNELKNKDSIFRKVTTFLIGTETKLINAQTQAQKANAAATNAGTTATKGLGLALKAIGIGLILALIPLITKAASIFNGISDTLEDNFDLTTKTADEEERKLNALNSSDNILKLQGKSEKEILKLKIAQTDEVIAAREQQLIAQRELADSQIKAAQRNKDILKGIITFLTLPVQALEKAVGAVASFFGKKLNFNVSETLAGLVFDPEETKKKVDEEIQATIDGIRELKNARAGYQLSIRDINNKAAEDAKKLREKELEEEKKLQEALLKIKQEFDSSQPEIDQQAHADALKFFQDKEDEKYKILEDAYLKRQKFIETDRDILLNALEDRFKKGKISEEKYNKERLRVENDANIQLLKSELDYTEKYLALQEAQGKDVTDAKAKVQSLKLQIARAGNADELKEAGDHTKKLEDLEKRRAEKLKELAKEVGDLIQNVFLSSFDKQKIAIDQQIDDLEKKKQKEIELANQTITNEQDKAAAITTIEARTQAQREALERRRRQIEAQRARAERGFTIARIIADTAAAVVAALGSKPWGPQNIALAAVVGAIGAVQIAKVLATPLPKFAHGTDDAPGGLAVVGDGGKKELVVTPDGRLIETPNVPTVMNVPKHSIVFPDLQKVLEAGIMASWRGGSLMNRNTNNNSEVVRELRSLKSVIKNKSEQKIKINDKGISNSVKHGLSMIQYIEENINFK